MLAEAAPQAKTAPPLVPALVAMTGLQALVALALFAPGVLAPRAGIDEQALGLFAATVFAVGAATSFWGGALADRFGTFRIAAACAAVLALAMMVASLSVALPALLLAGLLIGMAFGPETPASSALLGRLARDADKPLVFSLRQTGNQFGAMLASLMLPAIALWAAPSTGFAVVAVLAALAILPFLWLRRSYEGLQDGSHVLVTRPPSPRAALALLTARPELMRLALASMPYSAMQMALNTFFVSLAVADLKLSHAAAGGLLALAQAGGLGGRIGFGFVVGRGLPACTLLTAVGIGMALAAALVATIGQSLPGWALAVVTLLFGVTASGWNGVFLAEVARLAPAERIGEATGAVLVASYLGLVLGPLLMVAGVAAGAGLAGSYLVLAVLALAGAAVVAGTR